MVGGGGDEEGGTGVHFEGIVRIARRVDVDVQDIGDSFMVGFEECAAGGRMNMDV